MNFRRMIVLCASALLVGASCETVVQPTDQAGVGGAGGGSWPADACREYTTKESCCTEGCGWLRLPYANYLCFDTERECMEEFNCPDGWRCLAIKGEPGPGASCTPNYWDPVVEYSLCVEHCPEGTHPKLREGIPACLKDAGE